MLTVLYYFIAWPFILINAVLEFIFWGSPFSDGRWRQRKEPSNLARIWQEQAIELRRQYRELDYKSRRQLEEAESKFREELKRKEREMSLLRS